jgi:hypothetical protein
LKLDAVRVPTKYPSKKHFKGPNVGKFSRNPLVKNPEDVWNIPNVKSNHVEETSHPCQFPVGLIERLVLALTNPGELIFDPFAGVASTGVAAALHRRRFGGCEVVTEYAETGRKRIQDALDGKGALKAHASRPERAARNIEWMVEKYLASWRNKKVTIRKRNVLDDDEFVTIKSIVQGLGVEVELMKDWTTGSGGTGY